MAKKRPAVVVQADGYNQSERHVIVGEITAVIGKLSAAMLAKLNDCLKAVLDIP